MIDRNALTQIINRNQWLIARHAQGLTHEDTLLQLPFETNCMNWIHGHVAWYRDEILELLGDGKLLTEEESEPYRRDSDPFRDGQDAVDLERLLGILEDSHGSIVSAITKIPEQQLQMIHNEERESTILDRIVFLFWHETYHIGQLEIFRHLAGKHEKII